MARTRIKVRKRVFIKRLGNPASERHLRGTQWIKMGNRAIERSIMGRIIPQTASGLAETGKAVMSGV
jgi:hypothetical protein